MAYPELFSPDSFSPAFMMQRANISQLSSAVSNSTEYVDEANLTNQDVEKLLDKLMAVEKLQ